MNKKDFLEALSIGLKDYSEKDRQQYIDYYSEMIDDRIEEGLSEEEAIADIGTPEKAVTQIKSENPIADSKKKREPLKNWQIALIVIGSPIWFSLFIAAISVVFSGLVTVCSLIISLYAVAVSLAACGVAGVLGIIPLLMQGNVPAGIMLVGLGLISAGLAILSFMGLNKLTKWLVALIKRLILWIKSHLKKKEAAV